MSLGESSTVFVSGADAAAHGRPSWSSSWSPSVTTSVVDLGGLATARGTEMVLPNWLRLMGALGTTQLNFKVVR